MVSWEELKQRAAELRAATVAVSTSETPPASPSSHREDVRERTSNLLDSHLDTARQTNVLFRHLHDWLDAAGELDDEEDDAQQSVSFHGADAAIGRLLNSHADAGERLQGIHSNLSGIAKSLKSDVEWLTIGAPARAEELADENETLASQLASLKNELIREEEGALESALAERARAEAHAEELASAQSKLAGAERAAAGRESLRSKLDRAEERAHFAQQAESELHRQLAARQAQIESLEARIEQLVAATRQAQTVAEIEDALERTAAHESDELRDDSSVNEPCCTDEVGMRRIETTAAMMHDVCTQLDSATFHDHERGAQSRAVSPIQPHISRHEATAQTYAVRMGTAMSCGGTLHSAFNEGTEPQEAGLHTLDKTHGTESAAARTIQGATSSQKAPTQSDIPRSKLIRTPRTRGRKHICQSKEKDSIFERQLRASQAWAVKRGRMLAEREAGFLRGAVPLGYAWQSVRDARKESRPAQTQQNGTLRVRGTSGHGSPSRRGRAVPRPSSDPAAPILEEGLGAHRPQMVDGTPRSPKSQQVSNCSMTAVQREAISPTWLKMHAAWSPRDVAAPELEQMDGVSRPQTSEHMNDCSARSSPRGALSPSWLVMPAAWFPASSLWAATHPRALGGDNRTPRWMLASSAEPRILRSWRSGTPTERISVLGG